MNEEDLELYNQIIFTNIDFHNIHYDTYQYEYIPISIQKFV